MSAEFTPEFQREIRWTVRAGRLGSEGYRGCLVLPTRHGEIVVCATVPDGAVRAFRDGLRRVLKEAPEVGAWGGDIVGDIGERVGLPCVGGVLESVQAGLGSLGPYGALASAGLGAISSLFGGGTYGGPVLRPENLPAEGSTTNLLRIARHVQLAPGMAVAEATRRLENGLRQNWAGADHNDARKLLAALRALGAMPATLEQLANVATRVGPDGRLNLPQMPAPQAAPRPVPQAAPRPVPQAAPRPVVPAPGLAQAFGGLLDGSINPGEFAPHLGAASTIQQGLDLATSPAASDIFGAAADPLANWLAMAAQSADAVSGADLLDAPRARAILTRAQTSLDPRVIEAVNAARAFHSYLHEGG